MGGERVINESTRGDQTEPAVSMNASGEWVATWANGTGLNISARGYRVDGTTSFDEIVVNATTSGTQNEPTVAIDDAGDFLVAWTDYNGRDGDALGVIAQRFTAAGVRVGPELVIPSIVAGSQFQPAAGMDPLGNFVLAWVDSTLAGTPDIHARQFRSDGSPLGSQFLVNVRTQSNQVSPAVAVSGDGRFVIAWMDRGAADGSGHGVFFRLYDSDGTPLTGDVPAPEIVAGDQKDPFAAATRNGRFVVSWTDWAGHDGDGAGVYFRVFDRDGLPLTSQILANDVTSGNQFSSPIGIDGEGRLTLAWIDANGRDGSGAGVYSRCFDATGNPLGPSFRVNTTTFLDQAAPAVAVSEAGAGVAVYEDRSGADGDGAGILAQRYAAPAPTPRVPAIGPVGLGLVAALVLATAAALLRRRTS